MVKVAMPASLANKILNTEFAMFRSLVRRDVLLPRVTKPYYLPEEIANVVNLVDDILRFPSIRTTQLISGAEDSRLNDEFSSCGTKCSGYTTPDVLKKAYSFSKVSSATKGNSMSVAEFQYQYCK
jgi:hypothetical protein